MAPGELLFLQLTDTDSGLAQGQPELTGDASKPQPEPVVSSAIPPVAGGGNPWETSTIHNYR